IVAGSFVLITTFDERDPLGKSTKSLVTKRRTRAGLAFEESPLVHLRRRMVVLPPGPSMSTRRSPAARAADANPGSARTRQCAGCDRPLTADGRTIPQSRWWLDLGRRHLSGSYASTFHESSPDGPEIRDLVAEELAFGPAFGAEEPSQRSCAGD